MIKFKSFNRTIIEHLVSLLTQSLLINKTSTAASTLTAVHVQAISGHQIMVGWHRGIVQYHIKNSPVSNQQRAHDIAPNMGSKLSPLLFVYYNKC